MTSRAAAKNKNKKPLETTLGKAPVCVAEDIIDLSHIRKPIDTSIFGLKQVLSLFETATEEVRRYIAYECDIMYECRICRTIFRSLANFILHKRNYCRELYNRSDRTNCRNNLQENKVHVTTLEEEESNSSDMHKKEYISGTSSPIPPKCDSKENAECSHLSNENSKGTNRKKLDYILGRLQNKQESTLITQKCLSENISNEAKDYQEEATEDNLVLENMNSSDLAVFQTMFQNMVTEVKGNYIKNEVMEIHKILDHNEAILGKDGKIIPSEYERNATYTCTVCNRKFSTKKTLTYHIKYKHNGTRTLYQCPECRDTFANAWSVFRHLYKIHRKTTTQVKKLRNQVHANVIRRRETPKEVKIDNVAKIAVGSSSNSQEKVDMENQQWMDDLEGDNDLQRCGGCGRKFERKAALHSHSQFCSKRIAVCNSIKENSTKRGQTEDKQTNDKTSKTTRGINLTNSGNVVKGSQRRKPQTTHKMYRIDYVKSIESTENKVDSKILQLTSSQPELDEQHNTNTEETNSSNECDIVLPSSSTVIEDEIEFSSNQIESTNSDNAVFVDSFKIDTEYIPTSSTNSVTDKDLLEISDVNDLVSKIEVEETGIKENTTNIEPIKLPLEINQQFLESNREEIDSTNEIEYTNNKRKHDEILTNASTSKKIKIENNSTDNIETTENSLQTRFLKYINKQRKSCIPCKKTFKTYRSLKRHMALHFNWYRFQCINCSYRSYSKSRCEQHVEVKHNINDKHELKNHVIHLSNEITLSLSSEFTEAPKKCKKKTNKKKDVCLEPQTPPEILFVKENEEEKLKDHSLEAEDKEAVTSETETEENSKTPDESDEPGNSTLRKMIMEVILGNVNESESKKKTLQCDGEYFHGFEDSSTETPALPNPTLNNYSRPVRNRVPVVQKDFLYDMGQILKSKPSIKEKEVSAAGSQKELNVVKKIKPIKTYIKDTKSKKTGQLIIENGENPNVDNQNAEEPEIKIVEDVNMNSKDLLKKHITGDCD